MNKMLLAFFFSYDSCLAAGVLGALLNCVSFQLSFFPEMETDRRHETISALTPTYFAKFAAASNARKKI